MTSSAEHGQLLALKARVKALEAVFSVAGIDPSIITTTGLVTITRVDTGTVGPTLEIFHDDATPIAVSVPGQLLFYGRDSAGNKQLYGGVASVTTDVTSGTEDAELQLYNTVNAASTKQLALITTGVQIFKLLDLSGAAASQIKFGNANDSANTATLDGYLDWVASTPTLVGFGTPTGVSYFSARLGDRLEVDCKFAAGTSTAVEARIPLLLNGVSLTANATKIPSIKCVGTAAANFAFAGSWAILVESGVTYLTIGFSTAAAAGLTKQNGNAVLAVAGQTLSVRASVPISTW